MVIKKTTHHGQKAKQNYLMRFINFALHQKLFGQGV